MTPFPARGCCLQKPPDVRTLALLLVALLLGIGAPAGDLPAQTAPSVSAVAIGSPNVGDTFERAEEILVTVTFSAAVTVTGSPQLALTIGTTTRQAAYRRTVGNGLVFRYVVQSSDADTDGISIAANALALNGGTISGGGGAATLGLGSAAISNSTGHKVAGGTFTASAVSGVSIVSTPLTSTTYGQVELIDVEVTFARAVVVTGTPQLGLGIATFTRQANYVGGTGTSTLTFRYRVQPTDIDTNGISIAASALTLNGGAINDARDGTTAATLGLGSAAISDDTNHRVDGTHQVAPTVSSVSITSSPDTSGVYGQAAPIRVRVGFNLLVWVVGTPQLALGIGSETRQAAYVSGSGTDALVFQYTVQPTDMDPDGISVAATALTLNGATIRLASESGQGENPQTRPNAVLSLGTHALSNVSGHAVDGSRVEEEEEEEEEEEDEEEDEEEGELAFDRLEYEFELVEHVPGPVALGAVRAAKPGGGTVQYALGEGGEGLFEVDASSGKVTYVGTGEDAEHRSRYQMLARAMVGDETVEVRVTVRVLSVNEPPAFDAAQYAFEVPENVAGPLALGSVGGVDLDDGDTLTYRMVPGSAGPGAGERFEVGAVTGEVRYVGSGENYEKGPGPWAFEVSVADLAGLSAKAKVVVTVADVNEAPSFADSAYAFEVTEKTAGPLALGSVMATDPDTGDRLSYALAEGDATRFEVDAESGAVRYVGEGEDADAGPASWALVVSATDRGGLGARSRATVAVVAVNEAPTFRKASYEFEVAENAPGPVALGAVEAVDADRTDTLSYSLAGGDATRFEVDAESGAVRYVGAGEDAETGPGAYQLEIEVRDLGGLTDRAPATVRVLDVNEAPFFADPAYAFELAENAAGPLTLGKVEAFDADDGDVVSYSLASGDDALFEVDAGTGDVRYLGAGANYEDGPPAYDLVVRATDASGLGAEAEATVTVLDVNEGPEAVGAMAPMTLEAFGSAGEEDLGPYFRDPDGDALSYVAESSSPGVATASVSGGDRLSIQPQAIGTVTVTVTATDPGGLSATQQVQVAVQASRAERTRALRLALSAFGRSVGGETVEAIGGRLGTESSGAMGRSHVQVGGRSVGCGSWAGANDGECSVATLARSTSGLLGTRLSHPAVQSGFAGAERPSVSFDPVSWERISSGSSFQLALGGVGGGRPQDAGSGIRPGWTLWGRAGAGGFEGRHDGAFTLEGTTRSAYLGLDYRFASGLLVGVAGSRSAMASNFDSRINGAGSVDARLTSLYPYVHWSPRPGLGLWGLAGAGRGDADMEETTGGRFAADLAMRMAALGVRQEIYGAFALKADAFSVRIQSDQATDLAGVEVQAQRLRLAPELSRGWPVGEGMSVRASVEAGARFDGGDGQTGAGAEAGAELGFAHHRVGLTVNVRGRTLLAHQADDYRDWGAGFSVRLQPGGDRGGLSFLVAPAWGNATSGIGTLWQAGAAGFAGPRHRESAPGVPAADNLGLTPARVAMELGWGVVLPRGGQVTPFGRWSREGHDGHRLNVGTRWTILGQQVADAGGARAAGGFLGAGALFGAGAPDPAGDRSLRLEVDLFGEHVASGLQPSERNIGLLGRITFE